jgi:hypothetical protein
MMLPGTPEWRRRAAFAFLAVGLVLASRAVSRDLPHEQTLIFRLSENQRHVPLTLHASLTRVGESEACAGLTVTLSGSEAAANGDPRHTLRLPNGDYVVTTRWHTASGAGAAPKEDETSRVERVTLTGGESIVPLVSRAPE